MDSTRRLLLASGIGLGVAALGSASFAAEPPRWCAWLADGSASCGFTTIEQCRDTIRGLGGSCVPVAPVGHRQPTPASIDAARKKLNRQAPPR
jgi:hypothetical protein